MFPTPTGSEPHSWGSHRMYRFADLDKFDGFVEAAETGRYLVTMQGGEPGETAGQTARRFAASGTGRRYVELHGASLDGGALAWSLTISLGRRSQRDGRTPTHVVAPRDGFSMGEAALLVAELEARGERVPWWSRPSQRVVLRPVDAVESDQRDHQRRMARVGALWGLGGGVVSGSVILWLDHLIG